MPRHALPVGTGFSRRARRQPRRSQDGGAEGGSGFSPGRRRRCSRPGAGTSEPGQLTLAMTRPSADIASSAPVCGGLEVRGHHERGETRDGQGTRASTSTGRSSRPVGASR